MVGSCSYKAVVQGSIPWAPNMIICEFIPGIKESDAAEFVEAYPHAELTYFVEEKCDYPACGHIKVSKVEENGFLAYAEDDVIVRGAEIVNELVNKCSKCGNSVYRLYECDCAEYNDLCDRCWDELPKKHKEGDCFFYWMNYETEAKFCRDF